MHEENDALKFENLILRDNFNKRNGKDYDEVKKQDAKIKAQEEEINRLKGENERLKKEIEKASGKCSEKELDKQMNAMNVNPKANREIKTSEKARRPAMKEKIDTGSSGKG